MANYDDYISTEPDNRDDWPEDEARQLCAFCEADLEAGEPHALDCQRLKKWKDTAA